MSIWGSRNTPAAGIACLAQCTGSDGSRTTEAPISVHHAPILMNPDALTSSDRALSAPIRVFRGLPCYHRPRTVGSAALSQIEQKVPQKLRSRETETFKI